MAATLLLALLVAAGSTRPARAGVWDGEVYVMRVKGVINPITEGYFLRVLKEAEERKAKLLLVEMDTPGGLMESMWTIIQGIVNSKVPVAVYVCPPGSHAASAGTFILLASHVAAMAPSTTIGAAHPVGVTGSGGDEKDTMTQKVVNDAVTRMRQNAQRHGRNAAWAERAIRESATLGTDDAVKQAVVDFKAETRERLLELVEGRKVTMGDGSKREIRVRGAAIVLAPMTTREEILHTVSHPQICLLLMSLGITAIGVEIYSPGLIFPGVIGVVSLLLAFMGFKVLPINYVGLSLILFSFVLFVLELKLATSGLLTLAGLASMFIGMIFLIDATAPDLQISKSAAGAMVGTLGVFFAFVIGKVVKDLSRPPATGLATMVGMEGVAAEEIRGEGLVKVGGELWKARTNDGSVIHEGERVRVAVADTRCLTVERLAPAAPPGPQQGQGPARPA